MEKYSHVYSIFKGLFYVYDFPHTFTELLCKVLCKTLLFGVLLVVFCFFRTIMLSENTVFCQIGKDCNIHTYVCNIYKYICKYRPVLSLDEKAMPATNGFLVFLITELCY